MGKRLLGMTVCLYFVLMLASNANLIYNPIPIGNIEGTYKITSLQGSRPSRPYTFTLKRTQFVFQGCNIIRGTYSTSNGWTSSVTTSTKKFCQISQDFLVTDILEKVAVNVIRKGRDLCFVDADNKQVLRLTPSAPDSDYPLQDGDNQVSDLAGDYRLLQINGQKPLGRVDFTFKGSMFSFKGCNIVQGQYSFSNGWISKVQASTRRECQVDQDQQVIRALDDTRRIVRNGPNLGFVDQDGVLLLSLSKNDPNNIPLDDQPYYDGSLDWQVPDIFVDSDVYVDRDTGATNQSD